eukprot:s125_g8.t1
MNMYELDFDSLEKRAAAPRTASEGRRLRGAMTELDVGDSLPPYASEENKKLDAEVKQKQAQIESIEEQLERDGARVKIMTDHLVNVQQGRSMSAQQR